MLREWHRNDPLFTSHSRERLYVISLLDLPALLFSLRSPNCSPWSLGGVSQLPYNRQSFKKKKCGILQSTHKTRQVAPSFSLPLLSYPVLSCLLPPPYPPWSLSQSPLCNSHLPGTHGPFASFSTVLGLSQSISSFPLVAMLFLFTIRHMHINTWIQWVSSQKKIG